VLQLLLLHQVLQLACLLHVPVRSPLLVLEHCFLVVCWLKGVWRVIAFSMTWQLMSSFMALLVFGALLAMACMNCVQLLQVQQMRRAVQHVLQMNSSSSNSSSSNSKHSSSKSSSSKHSSSSNHACRAWCLLPSIIQTNRRAGAVQGEQR
jgi:uncharacterized membrane protein YgcG